MFSVFELDDALLYHHQYLLLFFYLSQVTHFSHVETSALSLNPDNISLWSAHWLMVDTISFPGTLVGGLFKNTPQCILCSIHSTEIKNHMFSVPAENITLLCIFSKKQICYPNITGLRFF